MNHAILLAGFGGQGILFAGKFLTYVGMLSDHHVSWLPSYGPEMRGGTANCSVIISETPVGSPIVLTPTLLVAMNLPSYDKFESLAAVNAQVFVDSALISREAARNDVHTYALPATRLAEEKGLTGLANMIMMGHILAKTQLCSLEMASIAMSKTVPARKTDLVAKNMEAIRLGMSL